MLKYLSVKNIIKVSIVIILIVMCAKMYYAYGTAEFVDVRVTKTERVMYDKGHKYLIFTDIEVFENTDTMYYFKFKSSDIYSKLETGKEYTLKVYGWRIPFLSQYRNIVTVKEKEPDEQI